MAWPRDLDLPSRSPSCELIEVNFSSFLDVALPQGAMLDWAIHGSRTVIEG